MVLSPTKKGPIARSGPDLCIGSPGQTRTADQVVTSALIFLPGLDYLITRPKTGLRVSGASPPISLGEYELKL
jgi:hypothetical protein